MIPGLRQKMYEMILEHLTVPEKQGSYKKNYWGHIKNTQEAIWRCSHLPKMKQFEYTKEQVTPRAWSISYT